MLSYNDVNTTKNSENLTQQSVIQNVAKYKSFHHAKVFTRK